jgi:hypothetical protein
VLRSAGIKCKLPGGREVLTDCLAYPQLITVVPVEEQTFEDESENVTGDKTRERLSLKMCR